MKKGLYIMTNCSRKWFFFVFLSLHLCDLNISPPLFRCSFNHHPCYCLTLFAFAVSPRHRHPPFCTLFRSFPLVVLFCLAVWFQYDQYRHSFSLATSPEMRACS